ncbi:TIGR03668 family PPOX class F420-dependent oxidoreductase [Streptomyces sp. RPT161]|uniref:TIGR03668 family PPOX class F420-dependent oxidoreductase n=1 Tax=Streptomyces sp. RPT161 TaxID=3015993 RepID=UPI0022B92A17|nr:TIGR03668 family PPOX class F420-dependent oxidoreductase [Streptomyces sp. RPT161]
MRLPEDEAWRRFAAARVLRLATVDERGRPHLVPAVFAAVDRTVFMAVDHKPKRHQDLRRLHNIRATPQVSLLVDHYEEEWRRLWWVRADGTARVLAEGEDRTEPVQRLAAKYPQYEGRLPQGPVVVVAVDRWTGWAFSE